MVLLKTSRRQWMQGLGAGLLATPWLPLPSDADPSTLPSRILILMTPVGTVKPRWLDWQSSEGNITETDLAEHQLGPILAPFEAHRSEMLVMRGINMESAYDTPRPKDHWPDHMNALTAVQCLPGPDETGYFGGRSIDQHIADAFAASDGATPFHSLQLGARISKPNGYMPPQRIMSSNGSGPSAGNPAQDDPMQTFSTLFADFDVDTAELERLRARRLRVLDAVREELASATCQAGGVNREKIEAHVHAISELEASLTGTLQDCSAPMFDPVDDSNDAKLDPLIDQQIQNTIVALACGLTRVVTLQLGNYHILHDPLGVNEQHHSYSHASLNGISSNEAAARQTDIEIYYATKIAGLIDRMANTVEGANGETLLDNTIVLWCHEQGSDSSHSRRDMPYVLFGGRALGMDLGRVVDGGGRESAHMSPHNGLLSALATRVGVPTNAFGDPAHDEGPLPFL